MKAVSYLLTAAAVFAAIFALTPHPRIASSAAAVSAPAALHAAASAAAPAAIVNTKHFAFAPAATVGGASFGLGTMAHNPMLAHTFARAGSNAHECTYGHCLHRDIVLK